MQRQELLPGFGGRKGPPLPNGFLQIKEPQLPFFPVMAPEANVLKRRQKDCFTSHKWGRSSVGKAALECCSPARAPAAGWRPGGGAQLALTWALLCGLLVLKALLTPSLLPLWPCAPGRLFCPGTAKQAGTSGRVKCPCSVGMGSNKAIGSAAARSSANSTDKTKEFCSSALKTMASGKHRGARAAGSQGSRKDVSDGRGVLGKPKPAASSSSSCAAPPLSAPSSSSFPRGGKSRWDCQRGSS